MSGATLTDKPNLVHEDEDEFDYDEVCEKLNFYFVREPADKDDSALRAVKPSFVHQVYDSRDKLALLKEISRIEIIVDCTTWISHIAVYSKDERLSDDSGASMAIVQPIIDKLSTESSYLEREKFEDARKLECSILKNYYQTQAHSAATLGEDAIIKRIVKRLQPYLLFFIDGASIIDLADPKWQVNLLLEGTTDSIVGFGSAYPFLLFPEGVRLRISQFFIIPPRQRQGLGRLLYETILKKASQDEAVREITVEDPNDAFAALRLACDRNLLTLGNQPDLIKKLSPLARAEAELLQQYDQQAEESAVDFRKSVKKFLLKRYPQCIPSEREAKLRALDTLFGDQMIKFKRVRK